MDNVALARAAATEHGCAAYTGGIAAVELTALDSNVTSALGSAQMGIVFSIDEKGTYLSRALDQLRAESLRENGALIRVTDDALIAAVRLALMEMHSEGVPEAALYAMGSKRLGLAWLDILTASIEQC